MKGSRRIVVVGDVMTDVIVSPEGPMVKGSDRRAQIRQRPGGSGANQAVWLGVLGARVTFAARVGEADKARWEAYFRGRGVEPSLTADPALPSGVLVTILDPDGERSFLTDRGANLNLSSADLPDSLLVDTAILVVSGYSFFAPGPRTAVMDLMARAKARGIGIAVDPASAGFLAEVGSESFLSWTSGASLLFANREEAALLTDAADIGEQIALLGAHFETAIVKCGAHGAALGGAGGVRLEMAAPRVVAVDSTGAGDAFAAGFLKTLCEGGDEKRALASAIAAGARAVQAVGGQPN
ncbi:carbohydrate kinase family protein [Devosia nitrariae]|uniref:Sugar kinase n=1 Tax=Devosia nitrariae TaxID=2071872 RepID=A0ABQ5W389_9HYPH|nr:PfkB family carbohydrate kinase [Devosia nitrariae]GLQ54284.1 sugar kinase [Devosia nitrariae]